MMKHHVPQKKERSLAEPPVHPALMDITLRVLRRVRAGRPRYPSGTMPAPCPKWEKCEPRMVERIVRLFRQLTTLLL